MQVVDHEPYLWFLFKKGNALFLDAYCSHGPASYSVLIELSAEEQAEYSQKGHAYLDRLAQAIQNSGPGRGYQLRDVTRVYLKESTDAVNEWRAGERAATKENDRAG